MELPDTSKGMNNIFWGLYEIKINELTQKASCAISEGIFEI